MTKQSDQIRIAYIGGGSQSWAPTILRDIIFKPGLERRELDIRLLDLSQPRARAIAALFAVKTCEWDVADRVQVTVAEDAAAALSGADFVLITISTGRLEAMLESVADTYEETARRRLKAFLTVLEPAVILGMGLLVGFIVFAMFLAIFRMNEVPF